MKDMKAVSPLIAAVLLIVFTIAVGAVVLNWMTQYTKGTTEKAGTDTSSTVECAKQILDIQDVRVQQDPNGYVDNVTIFLQNLGTANATITTASIYDDDGNICTANINQVVEPGAFVIISDLKNCQSFGNNNQVSASSYTVRIASDCGATDAYKYPQ